VNKTYNKQLISLWLLFLILLVCFLSGCGKKAPPKPYRKVSFSAAVDLNIRIQIPSFGEAASLNHRLLGDGAFFN